MDFEFATAGRILFGQGKLKEAGPVVQSLGNHVLIVSGKNKDRCKPLLDVLSGAGVNTTVFPVAGEPTLDLVAAGIRIARQAECDMVISMGGGSPIDAGKAIAALLTNEGEITDYLEVIGLGKALVETPVPFIAVPTTSGTGAEVTRNAVLSSAEHRVKVSLRNPMLVPKMAIVDPETTLTMPPSITASTGMDAMSQLIEPYLSNRSNPITDGFCVEGITLIAKSFRKAYEDGDNIEAREDMAAASLLGGMALANAGLGAAHGFAAPIGGMFPAPHGAVCAALLPRVMDVNLKTIRSQDPAAEVLKRFDEVAKILTGRPKAQAEDGIRWIKELCYDMKIPRLNSYGITENDFPSIVEKATQASSMKANPIELGATDLTEILKRSF